jgi:hypothetical protein
LPLPLQPQVGAHEITVTLQASGSAAGEARSRLHHWQSLAGPPIQNLFTFNGDGTLSASMQNNASGTNCR